MEDQKIIELFWQRSEVAVEMTAQKYGAYLKKIAVNVLGSETDAEECVNDAYLGAWNAIPPNRPDPLSTFLGRIARNIALNRYKRDHSQKRYAGFETLLSELEECLTDEGENFTGGEVSQLINEFLASVPAKHRNVFVRRYWYGDSMEDIARLYDMKTAAVKTVLYRLRQGLKTYMEEEGYSL
ncbi:MAG: RNA polymerase sigma factor [Clostridia bacterium]|nr:RNA polymerase sigma factor [Clostridia bacterium]